MELEEIDLAPFDSSGFGQLNDDDSEIEAFCPRLTIAECTIDKCQNGKKVLRFRKIRMVRNDVGLRLRFMRQSFGTSGHNSGISEEFPRQRHGDPSWRLVRRPPEQKNQEIRYWALGAGARARRRQECVSGQTAGSGSQLVDRLPRDKPYQQVHELANAGHVVRLYSSADGPYLADEGHVDS